MNAINALNNIKQFKQNNLNKLLYSSDEVFFKIQLGDLDLTPIVANNLISLEVIDNLAFEADTFSLKLVDDGIKLPPKGVKLAVSLGFKHRPGVFYGLFVVDELSVSGVPDVLEIKASSANLRNSLNIKRNSSFDNITIGELVTKIASAHQLKCNVSRELATEYIAHIDQSEESDASFLIRVLEDFGACVAVKHDKILIFKQGQQLTINGVPLPPAMIDRGDTLNFNFNIFDRGNYTGCKAYFLDYAQDLNNGDNFVLIGTTDNLKTLNHTYKSRNNAQRAAQAKLTALQRAACTFELALAVARPDLMPGMTCKVQGFKSDIDASTWQVVRLTHSVNKSSGFITSLNLERQF